MDCVKAGSACNGELVDDWVAFAVTETAAVLLGIKGYVLRLDLRFELAQGSVMEEKDVTCNSRLSAGVKK